MRYTEAQASERGLYFKFNIMDKKKQVIVYVDGYNFYYGLQLALLMTNKQLIIKMHFG